MPKGIATKSESIEYEIKSTTSLRSQTICGSAAWLTSGDAALNPPITARENELGLPRPTSVRVFFYGVDGGEASAE